MHCSTPSLWNREGGRGDEYMKTEEDEENIILRILTKIFKKINISILKLEKSYFLCISINKPKPGGLPI